MGIVFFIICTTVVGGGVLAICNLWIMDYWFDSKYSIYPVEFAKPIARKLIHPKQVSTEEHDIIQGVKKEVSHVVFFISLAMAFLFSILILVNDLPL